MSLALLQGYSSADEEQPEESINPTFHTLSNDSENDAVSPAGSSYTPIAPPKSSSASALPSALDAFSEVAGPPEFLNNCVDEHSSVRESIMQKGRRKSRDKKDLPPGAVVESRAQLVGVHERVRSDIEGSHQPTSSAQAQKGSSNPESSSHKPSMCLQCGIPKTYSSALGMVCPVCPSDESKKKGSTVKDKEKVKRMRGQSSHATWKSETEMQLRQQFD